MSERWTECKNILCIRPDNIGDLLMTTPALKALKETFSCKITILTSSMASRIALSIPVIDDVMAIDLPWVKTKSSTNNQKIFYELVNEIEKRQFDAAIVFTVYSQNPMPSILLAYLAGIPKRLAYCRENPYELLTDWVPDKEPYSVVQHQVRRDLCLVNSIGAYTKNEDLVLVSKDSEWPKLQDKLVKSGINIRRPWLIFHPGVSEPKRQFPTEKWINAGRELSNRHALQIVVTGTISEVDLATEIKNGVGKNCISMAGKLTIEEFILVIRYSSMLVSVNTSGIHIAAAMATPVVVLYALTNPQHSPWHAKGKVLLYDVPEKLKSKNEVIRFVHDHLHPQNISDIDADDILNAVNQILAGQHGCIPEMFTLRAVEQQVF